MEVAGCSLIGFGPPIILFLITMRNDPLLIIVCVASAFFWILSLLLSSGWWMIVFPLKHILAFGLVFSVIFQEVFRYLFYRLMKVAERGLKQVWVMEHSGEGDFLISNRISFVTGLGYGTVSCTFSLVNLLASVSGPGTVGLSGSHPDLLIYSSFLSLSFFLMHTFWNVLFFDGFQNKRYHQPIIVVISHLLISLSTLFIQEYGPILSLMAAYAMVVLLMVWTYLLVGNSRKKLVRLAHRESMPASASVRE